MRIWVRKYEAGAYDDHAPAADALQEFKAKVAALEQLIGRQALEIEFLKRAVRSARLPSGAPTSAITGPPASPSRGGVALMGVARSSFYAVSSGAPDATALVAEIGAICAAFPAYGCGRSAPNCATAAKSDS